MENNDQLKYLSFYLDYQEKEAQLCKIIIDYLEQFKDKKLDQRIITKLKEHFDSIPEAIDQIRYSTNDKHFNRFSLRFKVNGRNIYNMNDYNTSIMKYQGEFLYVSDLIREIGKGAKWNIYVDERIEKFKKEVSEFDTIKREFHDIKNKYEAFRSELSYKLKDILDDKERSAIREFNK